MPKQIKSKANLVHTVRANLSVKELTKAGTSLNLEIYSRGEKIGEMVVGRGSLYWYGANKQNPKRIDWTRFAQKMNELAYKA